MLAGQGYTTTVADARFSKPLDHDLIRDLARNHDVLLTIEEGAVGGFGAHVMHFMAEDDLLDGAIKVRSLVLPDIFIDHNSPNAMYETAGLDAIHIAQKAFDVLGVDAGDLDETLRPRSA